MWFDGWGTGNKHPTFEVASPCYIHILYPDRIVQGWHLILKKDIVFNLYTCVEVYHYHTMSEDDQYRSDYWWIESIAHFFDSIVWPASSAMLENEFLYSLPEKFDW